MIKGQCQCGAVKFRYEAELTETIVCHCKHCQIAQGSVFAFNSPIDERLVTFENGKDALKRIFHHQISGEYFVSIAVHRYILIELIYLM